MDCQGTPAKGDDMKWWRRRRRDTINNMMYSYGLLKYLSSSSGGVREGGRRGVGDGGVTSDAGCKLGVKDDDPEELIETAMIVALVYLCADGGVLNRPGVFRWKVEMGDLQGGYPLHETMSANRLGLFALPPEILIHIFGLLEGRQIARCGTVCSYFKHVIEGSILLQYFVKLDMFGYTDVSESVDAPGIPATRLNQLESHIDAWNNLDWVESHVDAPPRDGISNAFGVLCQGIFAMFDSKRVYCIQLPHLVRGTLFRRWTLDGFAFPVDQIEIDPCNNLLLVLSREYLHPDPGVIVHFHLRTLSDNTPHPRAVSHILASIRTGAGVPQVRTMGRLLGVAVCFPFKPRLEIWNWMTGQKMTVLDVKDDDDPHSYRTFEFLSATSIVVVRAVALEVYQIRIETPGARPVHTASLCMPYPHLNDYCVTPRVTASPRLSQCIDHGNLSDCSPFPSPSFPLAEDNYYLSIHWNEYDSASRAWAQFHVPLSSLRCSSMDGDALEIPWETWSKGFCSQNGAGGECKMSGGRLIYFPSSFGRRPHPYVSLFDLNRSRAGKLSRPSPDPRTDYARSQAIKLDLRPGEIRMERPHPAHLTSRSFTVDDSLYAPRVACDDEHIVFWGSRRMAADGDEDEDSVLAHKLIILTMR
ncbi:hypothetical protein BS47DRAFT_1382975 [Hydnum rufescens UP504]|uniref:F-box domain-containing protein n=1 Tax=Hydnum rufescens UP504 TaxID=1448309 RepID=A0A9P6AV57_9AGAM|nr:hypothetical protein BS47DRAFT_1382975 [Hydnum rufescens UP504]